MRSLNFTNGRLAVGIDQFGQPRDFYWPVGENHAGENVPAWKIGIFVDGQISWLDDGAWQISQRLREGYGETDGRNETLKIALKITSFVDSSTDTFVRNFHVINLAGKEQNIKLFVYQSFAISEARDGHDTAQFWTAQQVESLLGVQASELIFHYKGVRAFAIGASRKFSEFTIGNWGNGYDGSWRDAEDGALSGNRSERILTDSVVSFELDLAAADSARVEYFISAGKDFASAAQNLAHIKKSPNLALTNTRAAWREWLAPARLYANARISAEFRDAFLQSFLVIKSQISETGAVFASLDTSMLRDTRDAYVDCWPRDAANVLQPFLRVGMLDDVANFLHFAEKIITPQGFFWQMYRSDGSVGPNSHAFVDDIHGELLPIQTDETAAVLNLLAEALENTARNPLERSRFRGFYDRLGVKMADFLCNYVSDDGLPRPSYELWEVRLETTTYTTGLTIVALEKIAKIAKKIGDDENAEKWFAAAQQMKVAAKKFWNPVRNYFYRGFYPDCSADDTIDIASLRGAVLGGFDNVDVAARTFCDRFSLNAESVLAPRFENDDYHGFENPWIIASLWLAGALGESSYVKKVLQIGKNVAEKYGALAEQFLRDNGEPIYPAPLTWSHGEFLRELTEAGRL